MMNCSIFDHNGKFVRKIGRIGNGPGEYSNVTSAYYSHISQHIYFPRTSTGNMLEFDLDGNVINEIPLNGVLSMNFANINSTTFACYVLNLQGSEVDKCIIFNEYGEEIAKIPNNDFFTFGNSMFVNNAEGIFFNSGDKLNFKEYFNDTIYQFRSDTILSPRMVFNSGKYKVSADLKSDPENYLETYNRDYFIVSHILETPSLLFFSYRYDGTFQCLDL